MRRRIGFTAALVAALAATGCTRTELAPPEAAAPAPGPDPLALPAPDEQVAADAPLVDHLRHLFAGDVQEQRAWEAGCFEPGGGAAPVCDPQGPPDDARLLAVEQNGDELVGVGLYRLDERGWCLRTVRARRGPSPGSLELGAMGDGCSVDGVPRVLGDGPTVGLWVATDVHGLELAVGDDTVAADVSGLPADDGWHLAVVMLPDGKSTAFVRSATAYDADGDVLWTAERLDLP